MGDNTYRITKVTGAVTINVTTEKSETTSYLLGDADGDGEVTVLDATYIQRALVGISLPNPINDKAADVDRDEDMSVLDATIIQRWLVGIKVPCVVGEWVSA